MFGKLSRPVVDGSDRTQGDQQRSWTVWLTGIFDPGRFPKWGAIYEKWRAEFATSLAARARILSLYAILSANFGENPVQGADPRGENVLNHPVCMEHKTLKIHQFQRIHSLKGN